MDRFGSGGSSGMFGRMDFAERNERKSFLPHPNQAHPEVNFNILPQPSIPLYPPSRGGSKEIYNAYGGNQYARNEAFQSCSPITNLPYPYPTPGGSSLLTSISQMQALQASSASSRINIPPPPPASYPITRSQEPVPHPASGLSAADWIKGLQKSEMKVFPTSLLSEIKNETSTPSMLREQMDMNQKILEMENAQKTDERAAQALGSFFGAADNAEKKKEKSFMKIDPLAHWTARCRETLSKHKDSLSSNKAHSVAKAAAVPKARAPEAPKASSPFVNSRPSDLSPASRPTSSILGPLLGASTGSSGKKRILEATALTQRLKTMTVAPEVSRRVEMTTINFTPAPYVSRPEPEEPEEPNSSNSILGQKRPRSEEKEPSEPSEHSSAADAESPKLTLLVSPPSPPPAPKTPTEGLLGLAFAKAVPKSTGFSTAKAGDFRK